MTIQDHLIMLALAITGWCGLMLICGAVVELALRGWHKATGTPYRPYFED